MSAGKVALAVMAVMMSVIPVAGYAADTPTLGGGDCWQITTPNTCRVTWTGRSTYIHFRAIDDYSWVSGASWGASASAAVNNWNNAPGPQYYSFSPVSNDTWIYLHYSWNGAHGLDSGVNGITWNCNSASYCVDTNTAMDIYWSDIYINRDQVGNSSSGLVTETMAHESGHAMGLYHNFTDSSALMWPWVNGVQSPNSSDIGAYPGCSAGEGGMDCVYGYGD